VHSRIAMLTATTCPSPGGVQKNAWASWPFSEGVGGGSKNGNYFLVVDIHDHLWVISGNRSFPICYHPPPPGHRRHDPPYKYCISSMENIMFKHNSTAAMSATTYNFYWCKYHEKINYYYFIQRLLLHAGLSQAVPERDRFYCTCSTRRCPTHHRAVMRHGVLGSAIKVGKDLGGSVHGLSRGTQPCAI